MRTFLKWVEKRGFAEDIEDSQNPSDRFKLNNSDDLGNDYDHTLQELMKIVMTKYERETMQFLDGISQRDREVSNLLRKLSKENQPSPMREPEHPTQGDEVVPSNADVGTSDQGGGDE
jgi:hypothetical protein